jgi:hypothetical protein
MMYEFWYIGHEYTHTHTHTHTTHENWSEIIACNFG